MGYYYDHQPEIDAEITEELEEADRALQNPKRSPADMRLLWRSWQRSQAVR
jgi:hypothetical protein